MYFIPTTGTASTSEPKAGAQCGNPARWDLCGGLPARAVPTATPFAGAGRAVAEDDVESGCCSEPGEFEFPWPGAVSVRSAAVSDDEDPPRIGVLVLAHRVPPLFDGGYGEYRRVVVDTYIGPSAVIGEVVIRAIRSI